MYIRDMMSNEEITKLREDTRNLFQEKFGNIVFEEIPHRYTINGVEYTPVSNIISKYVNEFDTEKRSKSYAEKNGLTQDEVIRSWKWTNRCATIMGTRVHEYGESYTNMLSNHPELICPQNKPQYIEEEGWLVPTFPQESAIKNFYDNLNKNLHPIGAEFKMSTQYMEGAKPICGTADILFYYDSPDPNRSGFVIGDWKGLDVNTPIFTTNGWKTMGTVEVNDVVYDKDGNKCKVLHTSEIHHRKCYKITFDNNDEIISDNEHRWLITLGDDEKVMTSDELFDYLNNFSSENTSYKTPKIMNPKPINNSDSHLPIDPYVFGRMLCGYKDALHTEEVELQDKDKRILHIFLKGSYEQRLSLLRGIMDTKGYCNDCVNMYEFYTGEEWKIKSICILLSSLGIKPIVKTVKCKNESAAYVIRFRTNINPFLKKYAPTVHIEDKDEYREIIKIEKVDSVPTRCIEVDSPTHTFLCGENFLVTHNTNRELTKDFARNTNMMMLPPFNNMYDEDLSHYYVQFNIYQRMMESIGLNIIARRLIHVKRDGTYEVHNIPKLDDRILDQVILK